jgi:hypothetical protein
VRVEWYEWLRETDGRKEVLGEYIYDGGRRCERNRKVQEDRWEVRGIYSREMRTPGEEKRSLVAVEVTLAGVIEANTEVVTEVSGSEIWPQWRFDRLSRWISRWDEQYFVTEDV